MRRLGSRFHASAILACLAVASCQGRPNPPAADAGPTAAAPERAVLPAVATSLDGRYRIALRADPDPVPLNRPFELRVGVSSARLGSEQQRRSQNEVGIEVRAWMPDHGHGMLREPRITSLGDGRFAVTGLLFHMSGRWEVRVDVLDDSPGSSALFPILID